MDPSDLARPARFIASLAVDKRLLGVAARRESLYYEISEIPQTTSSINGVIEHCLAMTSLYEEVVILYPLSFKRDLMALSSSYPNVSNLVFKAQSAANYSYDSGKRLLSQRLPQNGGPCPIDPRYTVAIKACCALIRYEGSYSETESAVGLKQFEIDTLLRLDPWFYSSLGILPASLYQPLAQQSFQKNRQPVKRERAGCTLYDILGDYVSTRPGNNELKARLMSPLCHKARIDERLQWLELFVDPKLASFRSDFKRTAKGFIDVNFILLRLGQSECHAPRTWKMLAGQLMLLFQTAKLVKEEPLVATTPLCQSMEQAEATLLQLINRIKIIDFQASHTHGRIRFAPSATPELQALHNEWRATDSELEDIVENIWRHMADPSTRATDPAFHFLPSEAPFCLYIPTLGSFIVFSATSDLVTADGEPILPHQQWTYEFEKDGKLFFKTEALLELDQKVQSMVTAISEIEVELVVQLQHAFAQKVPFFTEMTRVVSLLDLNIGLVTAFADLGWTKPTIVEDSVLNIRAGRHPVLEHVCLERGDLIVPNDLDLDAEKGKVVFLTGPNQSGKSVLLKQVAVTVYLAHIGMFVPAQSATIGLTDQIFVHLGIDDSVNSQRSKFQQSCSIISDAINNHTPRSLLLIDEFGTATDPVSGAALLGAFMEHFDGNKEPTPRMIAASHYQELVGLNIIEHQNIQKLSMAVNWDRTMEGEVRYIYKVEAGLSNGSLAIQCAKSKNIKEGVLDRALEVLNLTRANEPVKPVVRNEDGNTIFHGRALWRALHQAYTGWNTGTESLDQFKARLGKIVRQREADAAREAAAAEREEAAEAEATSYVLPTASSTALRPRHEDAVLTSGLGREMMTRLGAERPITGAPLRPETRSSIDSRLGTTAPRHGDRPITVVSRPSTSGTLKMDVGGGMETVMSPYPWSPTEAALTEGPSGGAPALPPTHTSPSVTHAPPTPPFPPVKKQRREDMI